LFLLTIATNKKAKSEKKTIAESDVIKKTHNQAKHSEKIQALSLTQLKDVDFFFPENDA
jgi:hypothetical protein